MKHIQLFNVAPWLPEELSFLETLARNIWWCWNFDAIELFRRIDPKLWRETGHNPIQFLSKIPRERFEALAEDDSFLSHLEQVMNRYETEALHSRDGKPISHEPNCIAYFSLEYGLHESIKFYAGGLGCLSGDHIKSASDENIPLVAVGLLYRYGYFRQYLNADGWQQEVYDENEPHLLPLKRAYDTNNKPVIVSLPLAGGTLMADVWRLDIGRIPIFLLDTNIPANPQAFRMITGRLYEADRVLRLQQEILLGIGGFRALVALGYDPVVCHMNEGHASFASLGRLEHLTKNKGFDLDTAIEIVAKTGIFTTHTPLPAGHEYFAVELVKSQLQPVLTEMGLDLASVIEWGQSQSVVPAHELCMTILGFRTSRHYNGVSKLHGHVTRRMWKHLWAEFPENEVPITHITNGIHVLSWLSRDMADLFDRYLGPDWRDHPSSNEVLTRVDQIPDDELWSVHERCRSSLIRLTRDLIERKAESEGTNRSEIAKFKGSLSHEALTIGFARRFAEYKRATLLLRNPERLAALFSNRDRPIQIIIAGKAHPADNRGKEMIKQLIHFSKSSGGLHRLVFLENFDMYLARYMVQGCDVWLNTPRRPQEASGTSGMKAAVNGVLHVSTLDGWWDEAYSPECGWAIGKGETYDDIEYQDEVESQALFNLLENEIIPTFFDRPDSETPVKWTKMMKASIKLILSRFTSHRMISEYNSLFYKTAMDEYKKLVADNGAYARTLVTQQKRLNKLWPMVKVDVPAAQTDVSFMHVGDKFKIKAIVYLGEIKPKEVIVQVFYGPVDIEYGIRDGHVVEMSLVSTRENNSYIYEQELECKQPGRYGFTVRVLPAGTEWKGMIPGYIVWANAIPQ